MAPLRRSPVLLLAALAVAAVAGPGPAGPAAGMPAAVDSYRATDAALQATTAQLALARTRARALSGPASRANLRLQRRLEARKDTLMDAGDAGRMRAERALSRYRAERRARARTERSAREAAVPPTVGTRAGDAAPTGADAALVAAIDAYLASKASPLTGEGAAFVREARAVGLDPRLLVAISGAETAFGTYGPSQAIHNPFGMGPGIVYPSWSDAIAGAARNLGGDLYLGDGRVTIPAIHERWAPVGAANDPGGLNGGWAGNVGHYLAEQGGDPAAPVFGPAVPTGSAPAPTAATTAVLPDPTSGPVAGPPGTMREAMPAERPAPSRAPSDLEARVVVDPPFRGPMLDAAAP